MKLKASAVKTVALEHHLPVAQPLSLKNAEAQAQLAACDAEVMVVAAYGLILPQAVLEMPRRGCLNIHASLLPRWRGAAPIQRAILAGDAESGVTIMQMDVGLDTGAMLLTCRVALDEHTTSVSLHDVLATLGAQSIVDALAQLDQLTPAPQPTEGVTYAAKIDKAEALLDWGLDAQEIDRQIRAYNPFPGAVTSLSGAPLKIWAAQPLDDTSTATPGTVLSVTAEGMRVACGRGSLLITTVQAAGGKRMACAQFVVGCDELVGVRLVTKHA